MVASLVLFFLCPLFFFSEAIFSFSASCAMYSSKVKPRLTAAAFFLLELHFPGTLSSQSLQLKLGQTPGFHGVWGVRWPRSCMCINYQS
jgi:hypothetical protein